jgi:hypothetical protein
MTAPIECDAIRELIPSEHMITSGIRPVSKNMTHSVSDLYDMVNSFMTLIHEKPFEREVSSNETDDLESLIVRYVQRLRDKEPKLKDVPDELIPDALLAPLREALATMKNKKC